MKEEKFTQYHLMEIAGNEMVYSIALNDTLINHKNILEKTFVRHKKERRYRDDQFKWSKKRPGRMSESPK